MKKILALVLVGMLLAGLSFADTTSYKSNASPVTVSVSGALAGVADRTIVYKNITFPYPTRNLIIHNNESDRYVYVDVASATNMTDLSSCFLLAPDEKLELYDYVTDGISIIFASPPAVVSASNVSVLSTY